MSWMEWSVFAAAVVVIPWNTALKGSSSLEGNFVTGRIPPLRQQSAF
jgi:hypothetical protein